METTEQPESKESSPKNMEEPAQDSEFDVEKDERGESDHATQNPDLPVDIDVEDIMTKIRGDRIGDSMFSERFLLSTLIKLTTLDKKLSEDEDFEKDLCTLWDMTIEKDVISLLLTHNVLELFTGIIQATEDNRLVEILIGIIGNMCSLSDTRRQLCADNDVISTLLNLISSTDSLSLVQLMRFLQAVLVFENSGDELQWFKHFKNVDDFVGKFAFILNNSMSNSLLTSALEALNGICAKFAVIEVQSNGDTSENDNSFRDMFVNSVLIAGVLEAFKQIFPQDQTEDTDRCEETATPTDKQQKITNIFLDIHVILSQYEQYSLKCYQPLMRHFLDAISRILTPLTQPIYLFPLSTNQQGVLENINDIFQTLNDPFDEKCFQKIIVIWSMIDKNREIEEQERAQNSSTKSEWDDNDDETTQDTNVNTEDMIMTILEYLTRSSAHANQQMLEDAFRGIKLVNSKDVILKMHKIFSTGNSEPEIQQFSDKIKIACKNIWNVVILDDDDEGGESKGEENRAV